MKREELTAMGLTDEQIEKIIAENSKDVQAANAKANKNSEELTRLRELEKEYTAMKDKDLSDSERLQKDLDSANAKIAELEKTQAIANQRSNAASKFNISAEQASQVIKDDGSFDYEVLGKIISEKETAAAQAKEQEIANNTTNPGGSSVGGENKEKTEAEKTAETIGKTLAGSNEVTKTVVDSYLQEVKMKFTESGVTTQKEILKRKLGGELFEEIKLASGAFTSGVCKAGNPISATGTVDNATNPVGILLTDVYEDNPNGTILKAFGVVNETNANANASITLAEEAKKALPLIVFEK